MINACIATGPPDELIAFFYANMPYYQWHDNDPATIEADIKRSLDFLTQVVRSQGPFDGVLGFSQGAEMATRLVQKLEAQRGDAATVGGGSQLEGVILIGGVEPQFHTSNEVRNYAALCSTNQRYLIAYMLDCDSHAKSTHSRRRRPVSRAKQTTADILRAGNEHSAGASGDAQHSLAPDRPLPHDQRLGARALAIDSFKINFILKT